MFYLLMYEFRRYPFFGPSAVINDISELDMKNVFSQIMLFSMQSVNFREFAETFQGFVSTLSNWLNTNKLTLFMRVKQN